MKTHADKKHKDRSQSVVSHASQAQRDNRPAFQFEDHRAAAIAQQTLQDIANNSAQTKQLKAFVASTHGSPQARKTAAVQAMANRYAAKQPHPIQRKENRTGLPDALKAGIENLSGYSMDDVKVHYNSIKPAQLQARAYAQSTDIHLAPGQEKHLPHEAWHVVQQKQGRVKPTLQLKGAPVNDDNDLEREADTMGQAALQAVFNSQVVLQAKNKRISSTRVNDDESTLDKTSNVVDAVTAPVSEMIGYEGISGVSDALLGRSVKTGTGGKDDVSKSDKKTALELGAVADSITGLTGIMGFATGFKDATDPEASLSDRFVAFLSYEQGAMSIGESASKLTATATADKTAALLGSAFEGFSAGFGTIITAFKAIKQSITTVKAQDLSTSDKMKASGEIILNILNTVKSSVLSVKAFYEFATGSASGKLMAVVPGASIAIAALKLIMQAYYIIQSYSSYISLNEQQNVVVANADVPGDNGGVEKYDKMEKASEFYRKNDAMISNKQALIAEDKATVAKNITTIEKNEEAYKTLDHTIKQAENRLKNKDKPTTKSATKSMAKLIEKIKTDKKQRKQCTAKQQKAKKSKEKRLSRIKEKEKEIKVLKTNKFADKKKNVVSKDSLAEFTMIQELKGGNIKRIKRQGVHIAAEIARIVADVMILAGVGGIAGGVTKGVAGGVELALPAVRLAKQAGRNRAGREKAKKKSGSQHSSLFDTSKTVHAKKDFRLEQIRTLLKIAISLAPEKTKEKEYIKLQTYVSATGVNIGSLFKQNGKPDKQITMLFKAMTERDFI